MRTRIHAALALLFAAALVTGAAPSAQASSADAGAAKPSSLATFQGRTIDLAKSWEGAKSCAVLSRTKVVCYATDAEALAGIPAENAALGLPPTTAPTAASTWHNCPDNWLCLYAEPSWVGRMVRFSDDYWQSLAPYGFDHWPSSWTNNQNNGNCSDTGYLGNGSGDNRTLSDCSAASSLGSYDNVAVDVQG